MFQNVIFDQFCVVLQYEIDCLKNVVEFNEVIPVAILRLNVM